MAHIEIGIVRRQMGKMVEEEAECRTALAIMQKLAEGNPAETLVRHRLACVLNSLGDVVRSLGRATEAKGYYEREIALREPLIEANPTDMTQRYWMVCSIRRRGLTLSDLGDPAGAAADARRALGLCDGLPRSARNVFETACCHAALTGLTGRALAGVSASEGKNEASRAIQGLGRAVAMGYRNANELRTESALDPRRSRDDFRLLILNLAFPAEPFARGG